MGGSGATSGSVNFPAHVEEFHDLSLGLDPPQFGSPSVGEVMSVALESGGNPYAGTSLTDPSSNFNEMDSAWSTLDTKVTNLDATTDWKGIVDAAKSQLDTASPFPEADAPAAFTGSDQPVKDAMDSAAAGINNEKASIQALIPNSTEDWRELIMEVVKQMDGCEVRKDFNTAQVAHNAMQYANDVTREAFRSAERLADDQYVQDRINAFKSRQENTHQKNLRQFTGGMASINAVHSSAFIIGAAAMKAEKQRNVAEFDSQVTIQFYQGVIGQHLQAYARSLQATVQGEQTEISSRDQKIRAGLRSIGQVKSQEENFKQTFIQLFQQLFQSRFQADLQAEQKSLNQRAKAFNAGLQGMGNLHQFGVQAREQAAKLKTETERITVAGRQEYELEEIDTSVQKALWDLKIYEKGMNILSAPQGMATPLPEKKSKASQALGGALAGGAKGAQVGGLPGAGIGAVLGGISGLV